MKEQEIKRIQNLIYEIRGKKVMIDSDLAELYGVLTQRINESAKRNIKRFPEDFMFQLTENEWKSLISQNAISKKNRGGRRYAPFVFTEQGVSMLSSVINSERAIEVNINIMRTFVNLRHYVHHKANNTYTFLNLSCKVNHEAGGHFIVDTAIHFFNAGRRSDG